LSISSDVFTLMPTAAAQAESAAPAAPAAPAATSTGTKADTTPGRSAAQSGGGEWLSMIIWPVLLIGVVYFLMIRPEKKKAQARKEMLDKVRPGNQVVTIGGIHGEVVSVKDDHVIILVDRDKDLTLKLTRSAVNAVLSGDSDTEDKSQSK